jgi:CRP/FNR family transcriptional regulator, cyclic AMP receptor protein
MANRIPNDVVECFAKIPLFRDVPKRSLRKIVSAATEIDIKSGTVIVREGHNDRYLYVLLEGDAEVTRGGKKRDTIGAGEFFGELAFLDGGPRSATVSATSDSRLMILSPTEMDAVIREEPGLALRLIAVLAEHLRDATNPPTD